MELLHRDRHVVRVGQQFPERLGHAGDEHFFELAQLLRPRVEQSHEGMQIGREAARLAHEISAIGITCVSAAAGRSSTVSIR